MTLNKIVLFGEAEKGNFRTPYLCRTLPQLVDFLGQPPPNTLGLYYAIQALMFKHSLIFFRVKEEGFSLQDYFEGLRLLYNQDLSRDLAAVCVPGVGTGEVLDAIAKICFTYNSIIISTQADLYDYLTE
jgi:hypothetical protein